MKNLFLLSVGLLAVGCASDESDKPIQTLPAHAGDAILNSLPDAEFHVSDPLYVIKNDAHDIVQVLEGVETQFPPTQFALCDALPAEAAFACDVDAIRGEIEVGTCRSWAFELDTGAKLYVGGCK